MATSNGRRARANAPAPGTPAMGLAAGVPDPATYKVDIWPIGRAVPFEYNAKVHTPRAIAKLAATIARIGVLIPIVVDKQGVIAKGHRTRLACLQLGIAKVPVYVAKHASQAQIDQWRLDDNRLSEDSPWDEAKLKVSLGELGKLGVDLATATAFEMPELRRLMPEMFPLVDPMRNPKNDVQQYLCVVTCKDEGDLQKVFEEMQTRGYPCRLVT